MRILIFLLLPFHLIAQGYSNDPYQLADLFFFYDPLDKETIIANKVKKVTEIVIELDERGKVTKQKESDSYTEYNVYGNPIYSHWSLTLDYWWWPSFLVKVGLNRKPITHYNYYFVYDSLHRLTYIKELINEKIDYSTSENDLYFIYTENKVTKEIHTERTIYKKGLRYYKNHFINDTSIIETNYTYSSDGRVNVVYQRSIEKGGGFDDEEKDESEPEYQLDSLMLNSTFDSLSISKELPKGVKVNASGKEIERIYYKWSGHAMTSDTSEIHKYIYNKEGRLVQTVVYDKFGIITGATINYYDAKGLPISSKSIGSRIIFAYKYEYY